MSLIQQSVMNEDDELLNLITISRQHLFSKGSINNLKNGMKLKLLCKLEVGS